MLLWDRYNVIIYNIRYINIVKIHDALQCNRVRKSLISQVLIIVVLKHSDDGFCCNVVNLIITTLKSLSVASRRRKTMIPAVQYCKRCHLAHKFFSRFINLFTCMTRDYKSFSVYDGDILILYKTNVCSNA